MKQSEHVPAPPDLVTDYWAITRQPLTSLLFLLPWLAIYEIGAVILTQHWGLPARNGADFWMRQGLARIGLGATWLLPLLVTGCLLAWHVAGRYRWLVLPDTFPGMFAESVLLGFGLVILAQLQDLAFQNCLALRIPCAGGDGLGGLGSRLVVFVGAGVYEEVLFRLGLLPLLAILFRGIYVPNGKAWGLALLVSSLIFSAAHHVGPGAESFAAFVFVFRTVAGLFFGLIFLFRGFGIAVGAHAAYDLLVGLVLQPGG